MNISLEINEFQGSLCMAIFTDGATSLTDSKKSFKVKFLGGCSNIMSNRYMIHREALFYKKLINKILYGVKAVIHNIKSKA